MTSMPVSQIELMLTDGGTLRLAVSGSEHKLSIYGLAFGPIVISTSEAIALRDALNIIYR